jgi:DNA-binding MarR family transcriptional regulator
MADYVTIYRSHLRRGYVVSRLESRYGRRRRIAVLYLTQKGVDELTEALRLHPEWKAEFEAELERRRNKMAEVATE